MGDIPKWAGDYSKDFLPELIVSPALKNRGLSVSRKTFVNKTYSEPLSRTTEEPTHDEAMNNVMKKFHS